MIVRSVQHLRQTVKLSFAKVKVFRHINPDVLTGVLHGPGRFPSSGRGLILSWSLVVERSQGLEPVQGGERFLIGFSWCDRCLWRKCRTPGHGLQDRGEVEQGRGSKARQAIERFVISHLVSQYDDNNPQVSRSPCDGAFGRTLASPRTQCETQAASALPMLCYCRRFLTLNSQVNTQRAATSRPDVSNSPIIGVSMKGCHGECESILTHQRTVEAVGIDGDECQDV